MPIFPSFHFFVAQDPGVSQARRSLGRTRSKRELTSNEATRPYLTTRRKRKESHPYIRKKRTSSSEDNKKKELNLQPSSAYNSSCLFQFRRCWRFRGIWERTRVLSRTLWGRPKPGTLFVWKNGQLGKGAEDSWVHRIRRPGKISCSLFFKEWGSKRE